MKKLLIINVFIFFTKFSLSGFVQNAKHRINIGINMIIPESFNIPFHDNLITQLNKLDEMKIVKHPQDYMFKIANISKNQIEFSCQSYTGKSNLRYTRIVQFKGGNYTVLNILALPYDSVSLPILGIDIVTLPGGTIVATDFQPRYLVKSSHEYQPYGADKRLYHKWVNRFKKLDKIPEISAPYFSPYAIFKRLSSSETIEMKGYFEEITLNYIEGYRDMIRLMNGNTFQGEKTLLDDISSRKTHMEQYLDHRILNDPAKHLLKAAFGEQWTEYCLSNVMFPKQYDPSYQ